ncbi:nitrate- and nitrite sensing domain-containing protein [Kineosporia rhizophila]|uniref:sensor histidine kinase n=1 Tax=Kineosporia rhizophila TaxID=84633 RepID=UPI001E5735A4|nr:nitrate- and nitrite sensing domain-containing protein [Kineosporia rhizophila]MCE0540586.1 nitrate- and nitrite sensing domain-containing protein [Kineosporia rhizophila]
MAPKASGARKRLGGRSIRTRILMIGWFPSLSLVLVGLTVASYFAYNAWDLRGANSVVKDSLGSSQSFIPEARRELLLSAAYLADPSPENKSRLDAQRASTDQALVTIGEDAGSLAESAPPELDPVFAAFAGRMAEMPKIRGRIDTGDATVLEATDYWGGMIRQIAESVWALARVAPNGNASVEENTSASLIMVVNQLARGNGLAYVAFSNEGLTPQEYQTFVRTGGNYRDDLETIATQLPASEQAQLEEITSSAAWRQQAQVELAVLEAAPLTQKQKRAFAEADGKGPQNDDAPAQPDAGEDQGQGSGTEPENAGDLPAGALGLSDTAPTKGQVNNGKLKAELPIASSAWETANDEVTQQLTDLALLHLDYSSTLAVDAADDQVNAAIYGGVGSLLFGALVFMLTTRESNRLAARLRGLRDQTLDMAQNRLPALIEGLRAGEVDEEHRQMPTLSYGSDEIGEVADAFNRAQSMAVSAAVQEAETRAGLREVFLNIAYRSQVIVHRQLGVLEKAERFEEDPEQIELLFELDHLATRARRNAENLVILGGGQPGRRWRNSVDLLQVVRSSISEAQDYARVSIGRLPRLSINGSAVADVIHLLAELVDNATSFSPPMSKVEVRGNLVGKGLVIEIEDQGLGIPADKLTELNEMLTTAPDFHALTLREEPRLGMFVVAQLAAGQNIRVTLTPSPAYGGTKAVVLIPTELFEANPAGGLTGSTQTLAIDGADAAPGGQAARSLHERMAITGEMTGEISLVPSPGETTGATPALTVAPGEARTATGPIDRPGRDELGARPTGLHPVPPVGSRPAAPGQSAPTQTGPMRHAQSSFPGTPGTPGGPGLSAGSQNPRVDVPGPSSHFRQNLADGEPGPTVNQQARIDYPASRGNGAGIISAPPASGSLPTRTPGAAQNGGAQNGGLGKGAPTPPAGVRRTTDDGRPALPRRTRQAHLSDRLKNTPMPSAPPVPERAEAGPQGDPDLARNRMAAFQRGTQRGRTERPEN